VGQLSYHCGTVRQLHIEPRRSLKKFPPHRKSCSGAPRRAPVGAYSDLDLLPRERSPEFRRDPPFLAQLAASSNPKVSPSTCVSLCYAWMPTFVVIGVPPIVPTVLTDPIPRFTGIDHGEHAARVEIRTAGVVQNSIVVTLDSYHDVWLPRRQILKPCIFAAQLDNHGLLAVGKPRQSI